MYIRYHLFSDNSYSYANVIIIFLNKYGSLLPAKCVCGHGFTVEHAMNCSSGGFPILHHNEFRDFTAAALSEVCHDVQLS